MNHGVKNASGKKPPAFSAGGQVMLMAFSMVIRDVEKINTWRLAANRGLCYHEEKRCMEKRENSAAASVRL